MTRNNAPIRPMLLKDRSDRRIIFLYVERCVVHQNRLSLTFTDADGRKEIPAGQLAVLFLGSGTSVSSDAIRLCAEMGILVLWVAGGVTSYYAHGSPLTRNGSVMKRQSLLSSNPVERHKIAREMFMMRFPDSSYGDLKKLSIEQLRSKEGTRVRRAYKEVAEKYGFVWERRVTKMDAIEEDDLLNKAVTLGTSSLYGLVHSIILAIGASPSLGFVHEGHMLSFVYDITDLYKTELVVPTVFSTLSSYKDLMDDKSLNDSLDKLIRSSMREMFHREKLVKRIVKDIKNLLLIPDDELFSVDDVVFLWGKQALVESGQNWGD